MKPEDYTVAWISALPVEMAAAEGMLDEFHEALPRPPSDDNAYTFGRIDKHNVILACLPAGVTGVTSTAVVAEKIRHSFPWIKIGLMVGIGGGAPSEDNDIRLGDVIVSKPTQTEGGVIQYDLGKTIQEGKFHRTGMLNRPSDALLSAVARLQAKHMRETPKVKTYLAEMLEKFPRMQKDYEFPGAKHDQLFESVYDHGTNKKNCDDCDKNRLVTRKPRRQDDPAIFYGLIASANRVMKHGFTRGQLAAKLEVLCFEMEAAGLMNRSPYLIIRGVCDYADSHKNKRWQAYAAATAAAYAKELLHSMPIDDIARERPIKEILDEDTLVNYTFGLSLSAKAPLIDDDTFVGREEELQRLKESFLSHNRSQSQRIVTISGLGGIGKTQLTISFAKRHKASFSTILWFDSKSENSLKQSFIEAATHVFQSNFTGPEGAEMAVHQVRRWLSETGNIDWLLIFDNHDNPELPGRKDPDAYNIRDYFPYSNSKGAILITTRNPRLNFGKLISLRKLDRVEDSLDILANRSGRPEAKEDPDARRLALRLDGLPLALVTAGAYLGQAPDHFKDYLELYEENWNELGSTAEEVLDYEGRTLYSTWNISYAQLQSEDANVAQLLHFMAYLDNHDIWYELLSGGKGQGLTWFDRLVDNRIKFNQAMGKLQSYSLIELDTQTGAWNLHKCVHDWTFFHLNSEIDKNLFWLSIRCVSEAVAIDEQTGYARINRRLLPHADWLRHARLTDCTREINEARQSDDLLRVSTIYNDLGKPEEAKQMKEQALKGFQRALGDEHMSTLVTLNDIGVTLLHQGKLNEAEEIFGLVHEGCRRVPVKSKILTLMCTKHLGSLYESQGKLDKAQYYYEDALSGQNSLLGVDHIATLSTTASLGFLYFQQGQHLKAEEFLNRALKSQERLFGLHHVTTILTVNSLGVMYRELGRLDEAKVMLERVIHSFEKNLGTDHARTLTSFGELGVLYGKYGDLEKAAELQKRTLIGMENLLGPDHQSTLTTVYYLGDVYQRQGKQKEAEQMFERVLKCGMAAGARKAAVIGILRNLYVNQGKLDEAERFSKLYLEEVENVFGSHHSSTLEAIRGLGIVYAEQGKLEKAEETYKRAFQGSTTTASITDETVLLDVSFNLGNLYCDIGQLVEAETMYKQALDGYEKTLEVDHISTLNARNNLARLYKLNGNMDKAEELYYQVLEGCKKTWGIDDEFTLSAAKSLAYIHRTKGNLQEAEEMYKQALNGYEKTLGVSHLKTINTVFALGLLHVKQGKLLDAELMYERALRGYEETHEAEHSNILDTRYNLARVYQSSNRTHLAKVNFRIAAKGYSKLFGPMHPDTFDAWKRFSDLADREIES